MKDPRDNIWWRLANLNPAVLRGLIVSVIAVLAAYGIKVSPDASDSLILLVLALGPVVQALWTRGAVTPNAKVAVSVPDPVGAPNEVEAGEAIVVASAETVLDAAMRTGRKYDS